MWLIIIGVLLGAASLLCLLWLGVPLMLRILQSRALVSRCGHEQLVALTFDDGPTPELTPRVLDLLDELEVKATFFMIGQRVLSHPEIAREVSKRGHEVAAHSMKHLDTWKVGPLKGIRDVSEGVKLMNEQSLSPNLFRPPRGRATLGTIFQALRCGCSPFWWTHDSGDSGFTPGRCKLGLRRFIRHGRHSPLTEQQIEGMLQKSTRADWIDEVSEVGGVVLFHDAPGDQPSLVELTLSATRELVLNARERGTRFVLASELR
ncbi:MAG: hypothetical protein CBC35_00190 [Planctomycetes bacterium TMED75]|nr:hypothetical protein [Planctomycetaceae bacterium]OUU96950.1 MAG: hypothetical protein CBC35_00190 [Planctomycetes bacterium TMED75]